MKRVLAYAELIEGLVVKEEVVQRVRVAEGRRVGLRTMEADVVMVDPKSSRAGQPKVRRWAVRSAPAKRLLRVKSHSLQRSSIKVGTLEQTVHDEASKSNLSIPHHHSPSESFHVIAVRAKVRASRD